MLDFFQTIAIIAIGVIVVVKEWPRIITKKSKHPVALMDSSALIDGRVVELAKVGFIPYELAVPEFIVAELQLLADGNDSHKRERARFGLEVVQQLQREPNVTLTIERTKVQASTTDDKLVKLAKKINAELFTTDFNLNQVASIEGIRVLNVNELSQALRPVALPGEAFEVKIVQAGSNRDQGVGYMEDGTMIVIDGAKRDIGKTIKVNITRTHQTVAGKMLFGSKVQPDTPAPKQTVEKVRRIVEKPQPTSRQPRAVAPASQRSGVQRRYRTTPKQGQQKNRMTSREASLFSAVDEMSDK
ncbi:MAG: TRAM domain-containing protein [Candidatus Saccharimonadales bacterium]